VRPEPAGIVCWTVAVARLLDVHDHRARSSRVSRGASGVAQLRNDRSFVVVRFDLGGRLFDSAGIVLLFSLILSLVLAILYSWRESSYRSSGLGEEVGGGVRGGSLVGCGGARRMGGGRG
jgi:hypothetical protein